ncbi:MAG: M20 family metallopeptidase [bacterium]|nr:MAG: peptidase M20 [bacterium]
MDEPTGRSQGAELAGALERLRRYVEYETPTGDAERNAALAAELARDLTTAGAEVELLDAPGVGRHLLARVAGREPAERPLLLLGHMDTVWPVGTLASRPFAVHGDRAEGPGVYDMKAGLVVMVEAISRLRATGSAPRRPVTILVTCDEEAGSGTSRGLIEREARGAAAVLVLEPPLPDGAAKTARKGVAIYYLTTTGRPAHAGIEPERGVSAIVELAHQVLRVAVLADPARGTTINVGVVHGGTASNVVPERAQAEIDVRFSTTAELKRVDAALRALTPVLEGAAVEVTGGENRPPLERTDAVVELYGRVRSIAAELGMELGEGSTGGGSDGCYTAALGVPTLDGLGVRGGGAHATDEHIVVDDLPRRIDLLVRLLERL